MRKIARICLAFLLSLMVLIIPVSADVQNTQTGPDYKTDYYMIVESKAGGINIYAEPDLESSKLNEARIPNGTALHIEGEVEDETANRTWGYAQYHGMYGYVPLDDCKPAQSRQEAIDSELYLAGRENVDYDADYDVTASSEDGSQKLYQGPGEKYGTVPDAEEIKNGEKLHISQEAQLADGSHWGVTSVDGKDGWVDLEKTENENDEKAAETSETTVIPTETVKAESTVLSEKTSTPVLTEPLASDEKAATFSVTGQDQKKVDSATNVASQEVSADSSVDYQPFVWIGWIAAAAVIILLFYHIRKRK